MNNDKKALKSGIWYTVSNFLLKSIGFLTTPVFTRLLSQEDFGAYNNFTSWIHILTIIVTLDLGSTLISAKFDYRDRYDQYIFSMLGLSTLSVGVWWVIANLFPEQVTDIFNLNMFYINCMFCYLFCYAAVNMFQIRERFLFNYKWTVATSVFLSVGTAFISVILVLNLSNKLLGRIIGNVAPTILLGCIIVVYFCIKGKKIDISLWKYALPICLPYIPHLLSLTLLNQMDRVMITKICGTKDTALYSLAYNCGAIVTLLVTSINGAFSPWLGEQLNNKEFNRIKTVSKSYVLYFISVTIVVFLFAPEILLVLGGKSYLPAKYVMPPVAMGCVCQFLYTMFVNVEQYKKKTIGMAFASCGAALTNYILNYIMIPKFGFIAAAYTTLIGYMFLLFMHMMLVKKIGYGVVYDYWFIIKTVLFMLIFTVGVNYLYSVNMIRYILLGLYCLCLSYYLFINRCKIMELYKSK